MPSNQLHSLRQFLVHLPLFQMCSRRHQLGYGQRFQQEKQVLHRRKCKSAVLVDTPTKYEIAALEGNREAESV